MNNSKGFTLIELIIVCLILVLVILITSSAFEHIISKSDQLSKASKSNIDGIVGLELMRADLESTGFGLPWSFDGTVTYTECKEMNIRVTGIDPKTFNDAPSGPPHAIMSRMGSSGSDYLVIKSAAVGDERASRKWSYVGYSSSGQGVLRSYTGSENLVDDDHIITLSMGFGADAANSGTARQLIRPKAGSDYYHTINSAISDPPPGDASEFYVAYGISTKNTPAMPFNRVDYYVYRDTTTISQSCATGPGPGPLVGNLYRASINHSGGLYNEMPLLNCVLDMQVYYMLDRNNNGDQKPAKTLTNTDGSNMSAQQVREQVKSIQVNILTQEGGMDRNFNYPDNSISFGPQGQIKTWDNNSLRLAAGDNWKNYRWKVYTIVVQPKNLNK